MLIRVALRIEILIIQRKKEKKLTFLMVVPTGQSSHNTLVLFDDGPICYRMISSR
jgi:hypothetical protein